MGGIGGAGRVHKELGKWEGQVASMGEIGESGGQEGSAKESG